MTSTHTPARRIVITPHGALPNGRKRFCGAWSMQGTRRGAGCSHRVPRRLIRLPRMRIARLRCKSWGCSLCGPRKAIRYRAQILRATQRHKLTRLLTLTLDPMRLASSREAPTFYQHFEAQRDKDKPCQCGTCARIQRTSLAYIRGCWSKMRTYLLRRYGRAPKFIAVMELQKHTGLAHLHIVIDRYIEQAWIKKNWMAVGGGEHVYIQYVDAHRSAAYLSKYLAKDLFLSTPSGVRRVSTSRSIRLKEKKPSEYEWLVLKTTIDRLYVLTRDVATDEARVDGELDSFYIRE